MARNELQFRLRSAKNLARKVLCCETCPEDLVAASINCAICHLLECSSSEETMDLADLGAIATVIQRLTSSAQHIAELRKSRMAEEKKSRGLDEESLRAIEERLNLL